jgi:hypothetical protein
MSTVYVQRSGGAVVGVYAVAQPGIAEEPISDSHADVAEFTQATERPRVVSRFQAIAALHQAGLLTTVETMMADPGTPVLYRLAWQNAQEFSLSSSTLLAMAGALQLDQAELQALFDAASEIEA